MTNETNLTALAVEILGVVSTDEQDTAAEALLERCTTYTQAIRALQQAMRNNGDKKAADLLAQAAAHMALFDASVM